MSVFCKECGHDGTYKNKLCFPCWLKYGKDSVGKVNNYPRERKRITKRTIFQKIYGKSLKELAIEYRVSISTISNNHYAGLPLGTLRKPHGGRRDNNTPKLCQHLTAQREVKKWKIKSLKSNP